MKEQLITFETAKLAKEKGFNWETFYYRQKSAVIGDETILPLVKVNESNDWNNAFKHAVPYYSIPTQSLLQKWLREEKGVHVEPLSVYPDDLPEEGERALHYIYRMRYFTYKPEWEVDLYMYHINAPTYEEALEVGLQEALKLI